jgi:hypothetical protein
VKLAAVATVALTVATVGVLRRAGGERATPVDSPDSIYALDEIPTLRLVLSDSARGKLARNPRKYVRGGFSSGHASYADVAIRLKGHRSMRPLDDKPALKIRFDKYDENGRFRGLRKITLNNMVEDPTMMREVLGYRLLRAMGVPAPDTGYVNVYVNGERYGLYLFVESIDESFLARNFVDTSGGLYEGEYGCDLRVEDVDGFDKDHGAKQSRSDLRALASVADAGSDGLFFGDEAMLDTPRVLAYLAVSAFIGDFDGYRHSHNYRVYHEPSRGKWSFIPWGIDRAFKKSLSIFDSEGTVAKRCFSDAGCRLAYVRMMRQVADKFESMNLDQAVRVLGAFISHAERADPKQPHSATKRRLARGALLKFIARRPAQVRAELGCIGADGAELDRDGDGYGCMDCDDSDPSVNPGAAEVCDGRDNSCSGNVDDAASCACPKRIIDGRTFYLCDMPMPWTEAERFCRAQGLRLATVASRSQSRKLQAAAKRLRNERWWIGFGDRASEGEFRWADGSDVQFTYWAKGEPDNDACNQDCTALKENGGGKWHDTHCGQHRAFICAAPAASSPR